MILMIEFRDGCIILEDKVMNMLDEFVCEVFPIIERFFDYVIVGGYIAILFGRSRTTEDIDTLIHPGTLSIDVIRRFYEELEENGFWCFNAHKYTSGFEYLRNGLALRIARINEIIPNVELKCAKKQIDFETLKNKLTLYMGACKLHICPLEACIAYKFYLGSQKDIEDAVHIFCVFKDNIKLDTLRKYLSLLGISYSDVMRFLRC